MSQTQGRMGEIGLFIRALLLALGLYFLAFYGIEYLRERKGPWRVQFQTDAQGSPSVAVSQAKLRIANVRFEFPGAQIGRTNFSQTLVFDRPITNVPFGSVAFLDTTFQPGNVTLRLFGHQIEFLPRTLVIDFKEHGWDRTNRYQLPAKER